MPIKDFSDYGILLRETHGETAYAICPKCSASRKKKHVQCLQVWFDQGRWKCHHCGWWGYVETGEEGRSNPNWDHRPKEFARPVLKTRAQQLDEKMFKWFFGRGISKETVESFGITWDNSIYFPQDEAFHESICFPFYRQGELINIKYRGPGKKFRMEKDAQRIFFGLDTIVKNGEVAKEVIVVEGEMDALSLWEAGYRHILSVPNGAPPVRAKEYDKQYEFVAASRFTLDEHEKDVLDEVKTFIIAGDSDEAGLKLTDQLVRMFSPERCMRVLWPEGYKDANEVLIGAPRLNLPPLGAKGIQDAIAKAKAEPIHGIFTVSDYKKSVLQLYREGMPPGHSLGFEGLRTKYGKDLWTAYTPSTNGFIGYYNSGKSEFLEQIEMIMAIDEGWQWLVFAPETRPPAVAIAKLAEKLLKRPFSKSYQDRMSEEELNHALEFINEHWKFINPPEDVNATLDEIIGIAKKEISRNAIRGLVIDPFNELVYSNTDGMREDAYVGSQMMKLNRLAAEYDLWIGIVFHPKTVSPDRNGQFPIPSFRHVAGGMAIPNKLDTGITIYYDATDENSLVEIHVTKMRLKYKGSKGIGYLRFDLPTGTYYDAEDETGNPINAERVLPSKHSPKPKAKKQETFEWANDK